MKTEGKAVDSVIQYQLHRDNSGECKCETGIKNLVIEEVVKVESNTKAAIDEVRCYTNLTREDLLNYIIVINKYYVFSVAQDKYSLVDIKDYFPVIVRFDVEGFGTENESITIQEMVPVTDENGDFIMFSNVCRFDSNNTLYFNNQE